MHQYRFNNLSPGIEDQDWSDGDAATQEKPPTLAVHDSSDIMSRESENANTGPYRDDEDVTETVVSVMLDKTPYSAKPTGPEMGVISNRVAQSPELLTVREIATYLGHGCTFTPGIFRDGKRTNLTWTRQQIFALDFDDGYTLDDFRMDCDHWAVHPAFTYSTFSHTPEHHRFRAVFVMDNEVTDYRVRNLAQGTLMRMFPRCDSKCKEPARMFLGGLTIYQENYNERINLLTLVTSYLTYLRLSDSTNYSRNLTSYASEFGVNTRDRDLDVVMVNDMKNVTNSSYDYKYTIYSYGHFVDLFLNQNQVLSSNTNYSEGEWSRFCLTFSITESEARNAPAPTGQKKHRFPVNKTSTAKERRNLPRFTKAKKEQLSERCRLFHDFISGTERLNHAQLFLMATSLIQYEGGQKVFFDALTTRTDYDNHERQKTDDFQIHVDYIKSRQYGPTRCENGQCPYINDCNHHLNPLQQITLRKRCVRQIEEPPPGLSLEETRQRLRQTLRSAYHARDNGVHVIRSGAGVGKTEELLNQALDSTVVAFPTHALKDEAYLRALDKGHEGIFVWPKRPTLPESYEIELRRLEALQLKGAIGETFRMAMQDPIVQNDHRLLSECEHYLDSLKQVNCHNLVFTTHDKALRMNNPFVDTIVFDEDVLPSLLRISNVKRADAFILHSLCSCDADEHKTIRERLQRILDAEPRMPIVLGPARDEDKTAISSLLDRASDHLSSAAGALFSSEYFVRDIRRGELTCLEKLPLPEDKKYIILSATANEDIYRILFGDRLNFVDIGRTETKGRLLLHTKRSYSRTWLKKYGASFHQIVADDMARLNFDGIITYKHLAEEKDGQLFLKGSKHTIPVFATFGALQGLDAHRGKSIAIYGTPHINEGMYLLYGCAFNLVPPTSDVAPNWAFDYVPLQRNGFEFHFNCYSDSESLRTIQLSLIENDLVQAIGRARLLDNDTEVHLFSNMPITGGTLVN